MFGDIKLLVYRIQHANHVCQLTQLTNDAIETTWTVAFVVLASPAILTVGYACGVCMKYG